VGNIFLFVLNVFPSSSQDFPTASHALAKLELPYIHKLQKREGRGGKGREGADRGEREAQRCFYWGVLNV